MARVEHWFYAFLERLMERIPRDNWPAPESEYWQALKATLVRHGVTEAVADEATTLLVETPPRFLDQLIPDLLKKVREIWATSKVEAVVPNEREAAERLSKQCDDCQGTGFAARYRRRSATMNAPRDRITLYCRCPLGRWFERTHRTKSPDVRARIYDLEDYPFLWGDGYRAPPERPGQLATQPAESDDVDF